MKKPKYFQICPKCNSPDVGPDYSNAGGIAFSISAVRKCNNCGHTGTFFPSVSTNKLPPIKKRSQVKNQELVDRSFMKGYLSIEFLMTGIILILVSIILLYSKFKLGVFSLILGILATMYAFSKHKNKSYIKLIAIIIFLIYLMVFIFLLVSIFLE